MRTEDFLYDLPSEAIAQEPAEPRDAARLLVHGIEADRTRHLRVRALVEELREGDLLVVNDTRVLPARLFARRATGGRVELLFLGPEVVGAESASAGAWRAMVKPARKLSPGEELEVDGGLVARALAREGDGAIWTVELTDPEAPQTPIPALLERAGRMPLPPYIAREAEGDPRDAADRERYQTVYAREPGAVAAPTAGLHFTPELLEALAERGVRRATVTLHVGLGTFLPVTVEEVQQHRMHAEVYEVPPAAVEAVAACRAAGGRVVAVGTTSVRALESSVDEQGALVAGAGETRLFLKPGDRLQVVDGLMTNFHLPGSTLLMLVSALAGRERMLGLYEEALREGYRFYSYGDAMLLLPD